MAEKQNQADWLQSQTCHMLRKEQQEAEKLEADIKEERTSWKVRGDISQGKLTEISSGCWLFIIGISLSLAVCGFLTVGGRKCHIIGHLLIFSLIWVGTVL